MKVLFLSINSAWVPHFETDLELMADHLEQGDDVFVIRCSGSLPTCNSNPRHVKTGCLKCISRFDQGMQKIGLSPKNIITLNKKLPQINLPSFFNTVQELKTFKLWGVNFGLCIASSLISQLRDDNFDTIKHQEIITKHLITAIRIYSSVYKTLQTLKPDLFYVFNGRFSDVAPALIACQQLGVTFYTHERAGTNDRYSLFKDCLPHSLAYSKNSIIQLWKTSESKDQEALGAAWFIDRRNGVQQAWYSFVASQEKNSIPSTFNVNKKNIAIFNSSIDEYATFDEWQNNVYQDERLALAVIIEAFKDNQEIHFYIRVHPNLKNTVNAQMYGLHELNNKNYKNVTIIWPEEQVDSYALLDQCEKVITFGSTIGIEACFWGKPSILIGRAFYEDLDACYLPKNHQEVLELTQAKLEPKPKEGALMYGLWAQMRGIPFKRFQATGLFKGAFLGEVISPKFCFKDKILFKFYDKYDHWKQKQ